MLISEFDRSALPVSSLINTYCRNNNNKAVESDVVKQIIKMFEDELKYNCKSETEEQTSRMLKALKSIGNAGNADRVATTLNLCVANTKAPIVIRVAAINAFRRIDCSVSVSCFSFKRTPPTVSRVLTFYFPIMRGDC